MLDGLGLLLQRPYSQRPYLRVNLRNFFYRQHCLSIYLSNKEKTCFFVRLSVCLSTFLILSYFSKSIIVTQKIIIELRVKNSKEGNWKGKMWIR